MSGELVDPTPRSPWPEMRHDQRNTGSTSRRAQYGGDQPWSYRTARGIFSTPVLGGDGAIYFGSADGAFSALEPDGRLRWSSQTGGIIDSAALVSDDTVTIGSGDGYLYRFSTTGSDAGRLLWRYGALQPEGAGQQVSWWEGNVVEGPGGLLLAGNTAGHAYALHGDGTLAWSFPTTNAVWTAAAVRADGVSYWGSLDFCIHAVGPDGVARWSTPTLGFVVGSPALSLDDTLYVGSFDGQLYALDASTGAKRWSFSTSDSIYSSAALLEVDGETRAIIVGSTEGSLYALESNGTLRWRFDTGAVVRSSPAIGRKPEGEDGWIVYVGAADGVLSAIDAESGERRWSYDLSSSEAALVDRSSLNGSPALGTSGIYLGSENGSMCYVPYDYPLHHDDPRGARRPAEPYPGNEVRLYLVSPGGVTNKAPSAEVSAGAAVVVRLVAREGGLTLDAELGADLDVTCTPAVPVRTRRSGDGHFLFIVPETFWRSGVEHRLDLRCRWSAERTPRDGMVPSGVIEQELRFTVPPRPTSPSSAVSLGGSAVLLLQRLAVALPSFAASVNQIGFDSYDWLLGVAASTPLTERTGGIVLVARGAKRNPDGAWAVDPDSDFHFVLAGQYDGDAVCVSAGGIDLPFSFGEVPMDRFDLRFQLGLDGAALPGASMYAETVCADIPFYGPLITDFTRLADAEGRMSLSGTFLLSVLKPQDLAFQAMRSVEAIDLTIVRPGARTAGEVTVTWPLPHRGGALSVVLLDADTGAFLAAPQFGGVQVVGDREVVNFPLDPDRKLPEEVDLVVLEDVTPLLRRTVVLPPV